MPAGMAKGQLNLPRPQGNRMTLDQALAFGLLAATIGLFLWGRLPYDLVALGALLAGVVLGVVPAASAFSGFSDDVVVIVGAALVISHAVARSGDQRDPADEPSAGRGAGCVPGRLGHSTSPGR